MKTTDKNQALQDAIKLQEINARRESRELSRLSNILLSSYDLAGIVGKLQNEESIVIDSNGNLYKGRVKLEKLTELPGKFPGYKAGGFDGNGFQEFVKSKSWVNSPSPAFKNYWESGVFKTVKNIDSPVVDLFIEKMESLSEVELSQITVNVITREHGQEFYEISLPNYPVVLGVFKTGTVYYYICNGKRYDIK